MARQVRKTRLERRHNRVGRLGTTLEHDFGRTGGSTSGLLYVNPKLLQRSERGTFRGFTRYHAGGKPVYRMSLQLGPPPQRAPISLGSTLVSPGMGQGLPRPVLHGNCSVTGR